MAKISSSSRIFEKRGDPWLSDKEAVKDFERNPETENPEYDFDHRFHLTEAFDGFAHPTIAPKRPEAALIKKVKAAPSETVEPDFLTRIANVRSQHRNKRLARVENHVRGKPERSHPHIETVDAEGKPVIRSVDTLRTFSFKNVPDDKLV
jgi:hypothetical protein